MTRPFFLGVGFDQSGQFSPLNYESVGTRLDNVKFDKEWGTLMVSDIRVVWYKKRSGSGKSLLKGALAATALGIAGSVAGDLVGRSVGGWAGRIADHVITSAGYAASSGIIFNAMTGNDFMNFSQDGKLDSIAVPLASIKDATTDKKGLTLVLESGDTMRFEVKNVNTLPAIKAMIISKKKEGKCPYCGAIVAPGNTSCQSCGAPVRASPTTVAPMRPAIPNITVQTGAPSPAVKVTCPSCGKQVPPTKFCCECGSQMGHECPNCGEPIPTEVSGKFCPHCGQKL
ncbi:MAG: zinc ribbon domain-containing protein [Candidatus Jordarchaeum sp.]|uniref:zinc ribbon domain-containing protein n=1 Tax=Candidatus Jordarchaeum sp. TaxID=2823881 RepID=UPI00404A626E